MTDFLTHESIDAWAEDGPDAPVALHLKQKLLPVEGEGGVIFPPTYADIGYNIDTLSDGTKVATIDSVGSQANRIEPIFKEPPYSALVPQIEIVYGNDKVVTIFDAGHRLGDALIRCVAPDESGFDLTTAAHEAFTTLQERNDAGAIAKLAPTSLVFGAWDSRETQAKLPRIVQAVIRAWDVEVLHAAAQYVPPVDYVVEGLLEKPKDKAEADNRSSRGFQHAPAIWRDDAHKERTLGGVVARGPIERTVTVNLVALRRLSGEDASALRRYVLGLSLVAATAPFDPFLRQGCLLVPDPNVSARWSLVARDGTRAEIPLTEEDALAYAQTRARAFGVGPSRRLRFSKERARKEAKKKSDNTK